MQINTQAIQARYDHYVMVSSLTVRAQAVMDPRPIPGKVSTLLACSRWATYQVASASSTEAVIKYNGIQPMTPAVVCKVACHWLRVCVCIGLSAAMILVATSAV
jgi:hypothetical protein